jgi:hypothetical protein
MNMKHVTNLYSKLKEIHNSKELFIQQATYTRICNLTFWSICSSAHFKIL